MLIKVLVLLLLLLLTILPSKTINRAVRGARDLVEHFWRRKMDSREMSESKHQPDWFRKCTSAEDGTRVKSLLLRIACKGDWENMCARNRRGFMFQAVGGKSALDNRYQSDADCLRAEEESPEDKKIQMVWNEVYVLRRSSNTQKENPFRWWRNEDGMGWGFPYTQKLARSVPFCHIHSVRAHLLCRDGYLLSVEGEPLTRPCGDADFPPVKADWHEA